MTEKIVIESKTVLAYVTCLLETYKAYRKNSEQCMSAIRAAKHEDEVTAIIQTIKFDKRMMEVYLERAAAVLELIGVFNSSTDSIDCETIEQKLKEIAS